MARAEKIVILPKIPEGQRPYTAETAGPGGIEITLEHKPIMHVDGTMVSKLYLRPPMYTDLAVMLNLENDTEEGTGTALFVLTCRLSGYPPSVIAQMHVIDSAECMGIVKHFFSNTPPSSVPDEPPPEDSQTT